MDIEEIVQKIVDNGNIEDMHKLIITFSIVFFNFFHCIF